MFVLASYPRSGNTFFRNVLYEVYGIESVPYNLNNANFSWESTDTIPVIKTHFLPEDLPAHLMQLPSVYLVRDGRDALVSSAYKRLNQSKDPKPSFNRCLLENIMAQKGHHFGGWSNHIKQWSSRADIIIHFEDLIKNPIQEIEKLRSIIKLSIPKENNIPTFEDLKKGKGKYPIYKSKKEAIQKANLFYRKGKIGNWKNEIPNFIYILFLNVHGEMLEKMGYNLYPDHYIRFKKFKNIIVEKVFYYILLILLKIRIL